MNSVDTWTSVSDEIFETRVWSASGFVCFILVFHLIIYSLKLHR